MAFGLEMNYNILEPPDTYFSFLLEHHARVSSDSALFSDPSRFLPFVGRIFCISKLYLRF